MKRNLITGIIAAALLAATFGPAFSQAADSTDYGTDGGVNTDYSASVVGSYDTFTPTITASLVPQIQADGLRLCNGDEGCLRRWSRAIRYMQRAELNIGLAQTAESAKEDKARGTFLKRSVTLAEAAEALLDELYKEYDKD